MGENLKDYRWQLSYHTSSENDAGKPTDILHDFYLPALSRAVAYDRVAGYFRSSSLAAASQGYTAFLNHGGHMRLIVGADLQLQDVAAILEGNRQRLSDTLMNELSAPDTWPDDVRNGVSLLSCMVASGQLDMKVAFRRSVSTGKPLAVDSTEDGYVHEKWFVLGDADGNHLLGSGSLNESRTALSLNAENIDVSCDWEERRESERVKKALSDFEQLWENNVPHMLVLPLPDAVKQRLVHLKDLRERPTEVDGTVLCSPAAITPEEILRFAVLKDAPKMPGGQFIGMYSAPVEPWPHQEIVSHRLIESWPYSYMMCDEVGLGKTIEAALAIRSLVLSGRVRRVLIVAPASLTDQWQRELAQKAMLPFDKSRPKPGTTDKIQHLRIYPCESEDVDASLYAPDMNIVSSGLVSRKERQSSLKSSQPCDIILVDEAHYARRQNSRDGTESAPKYVQLYLSMQDCLRRKAKSFWMATATPMQINRIEVYDLFRLTHRTGPYQEDPTLSMAYFSLLGKLVQHQNLTKQEWSLLGQSYAQIQALDPYLWNNLKMTAVNGKNKKVLDNLYYQEPKKADVKYLLQPMFAASPLSRVMMRHSRQLLEIYRQNGELKSNLAKRHVRPICAVKFTKDEAEFYGMLDDYCSELTRQIKKHNPQSKQMMFFLLSFLQQRFASSLYAIQQTLSRRLYRVNLTLQTGAKTFDNQEELDDFLDEMEDEAEDYSEGDLDEIKIETLLKDRSLEDLEWEKNCLEKMLEKLDSMRETPSKIQTLLGELENRRSGGDRIRQTVLFSRFLDSITSIREYLSIRSPRMRVGIFSGQQAKYYDPAQHKDRSITHEEIKRLFLAGEIDLLLCTDAAAEGLNLQTADLLINFDLGWNPMKIEQRIGRIDRIGQKYSDIEVLNMCYLGSVEETVYGRLLNRLKDANLIVGTQQISMLPVEPQEFRDLQSGAIDEEELERRSKKRLKEQREAAAAMEISADDQYEMYHRMSAEIRSETLPATLNDIWDALTTSQHIMNSGAAIDESGVFSLPASEFLPAVSGTIQRDKVSESAGLLTWGNDSLEQLLDSVTSDLEDYKNVIQRISVRDDGTGIETVGYAVSGEAGVILITAYSQIRNIQLSNTHALTSYDISSCKKALEKEADFSLKQINTSVRVEQDNCFSAKLQQSLIHCVAVEVLSQELQAGQTKYWDAVKHLSETRRVPRLVHLPTDTFSGNEQQLLFSVTPQNGQDVVMANGILIDCALELSMRIASSMKVKKSEIKTEDVIKRIPLA